MRRLEEHFAAWARARPDVRAALVVGSRARADHPADAYSDLDLVVVANDPSSYLTEAGWLGEIGAPWLTFTEPTVTGGGLERRVIFDGGRVVDFAFFSTRTLRALLWLVRARRALPLLTRPSPNRLRRTLDRIEEFRAVVGRGRRVLLDKDDLLVPLLRALDAMPVRPAPMPGPEEVREVVDDFLYNALRAARKLQRGELMVAKTYCDCHLKDLLVRVAAWHARAAPGQNRDTWHRGRFFEEWADPRVVAGLRDAYARYDASDVDRGLRITIGLFSWVAKETTERLRYPYPLETDERLTALVFSILDEENRLQDSKARRPPG